MGKIYTADEFIGPSGPIGANGAQGFQGPIGDAGAQGFQGNQGPIGIQGSVGSQGNQGPIGLQGTVGVQGNQGPIGNQGFQGSIGIQGTTGAQGNQGPVGVQGFQGQVGAQGFQGRQGPVGAQGFQGPLPSITNNVDNYVVTATGTALNGEVNLTFNGSLLSVGGNATASGQFYSPVNAKGNSATAVTFSWNDGNIQTVTMTGNATFTFSNPQSGASYQIIITQDATGGRTITWPTIHWEGKTIPSLTGTANSKDIVTLTYDGTNYNGVIAKNFGT